MRFTFGIVTNNSTLVPILLGSIRAEVPDPEIIVVGGSPISGVVHVPFDESQKHAWITRKKNIITEKASNNNIVYMHDYLVLEKGWYNGFIRVGDNWDVCMTVIKNKDGTRYRDWVTWDDPDVGMKRVDYSYTKTQFLYISGAYWVAKKDFMEENPLNESLSWGEGEDVEWSKRIRDTYKYTMNPYSEVSLLKQKKVVAL